MKESDLGKVRSLLSSRSSLLDQKNFWADKHKCPSDLDNNLLGSFVPIDFINDEIKKDIVECLVYHFDKVIKNIEDQLISLGVELE